jgi:ApbE superfamily uncharacterized protein (UPF0280 family)
VERHHFEYKETIVTFLCEREFLNTGVQSLMHSRKELDHYIMEHPVFQKTHKPYPSCRGDSQLIQTMIRETSRVGVGPMASVAGAFAEAALRAMRDGGADQAIVDNGGDIAFFIREPVNVGVYAGNSPIRNLAFELEPRDELFGICTSSGTVGPSFSYGTADAAVVISQNVTLADAAATALGNRVKDDLDLNTCFDFMETIPEIEGALVVFRDKISLWGKLPKLVHSEVDWNIITKGKQKENSL